MIVSYKFEVSLKIKFYADLFLDNQSLIPFSVDPVTILYSVFGWTGKFWWLSFRFTATSTGNK